MFEGPLVEFLEKPANGFTGKDFIYLNTAWKELVGNAFWEKEKGMKLSPMIASNVKPVFVNSGVKMYQPDARLPVLVRHSGITWIIWEKCKLEGSGYFVNLGALPLA